LKKDWPWVKNTLCPPEFLNQLIVGGGTEGGNVKYNFCKWAISFIVYFSLYFLDEMFANKYNKPFALPESGAAFNIYNYNSGAVAPGPGELAFHQAYWRSFLTNTSFFTIFPRFKLISTSLL
jgi:hypothetical protein